MSLSIPINIYLFKVRNRNTGVIYFKITRKTSEQYQWRRSCVFIGNFKHTTSFSSISIVNFEHLVVFWEWPLRLWETSATLDMPFCPGLTIFEQKLTYFSATTSSWFDCFPYWLWHPCLTSGSGLIWFSTCLLRFDDGHNWFIFWRKVFWVTFCYWLTTSFYITSLSWWILAVIIEMAILELERSAKWS